MPSMSIQVPAQACQCISRMGPNSLVLVQAGNNKNINSLQVPNNPLEMSKRADVLMIKDAETQVEMLQCRPLRLH